MAGEITVRAMQPFGYEITSDIDLRRPLGEAVRTQLIELFEGGHLLAFRGQQLSMDEQKTFSAHFGPILDSDSTYISTEPTIGALGRAQLAFHSDLACTPNPFLGLSLHATDVVDAATSTTFADTATAAAALPGELRRRIEGRRAMHLWPTSLDSRQRSAAVRADWPGAAHPVLMKHPRTGTELLFVSAHQTDRILDVDPADSEAIIDELYRYLYAPSNLLEHVWHNGDLVIWDNLALQHARSALDGPGPRTLQRVALAECGYAELMPAELLQAYSMTEIASPT